MRENENGRFCFFIALNRIEQEDLMYSRVLKSAMGEERGVNLMDCNSCEKCLGRVTENMFSVRSCLAFIIIKVRTFQSVTFLCKIDCSFGPIFGRPVYLVSLGV